MALTATRDDDSPSRHAAEAAGAGKALTDSATNTSEGTLKREPRLLLAVPLAASARRSSVVLLDWEQMLEQ